MPHKIDEEKWVSNKIEIASTSLIGSILNFTIFWNLFEERFYSSDFNVGRVNRIFENGWLRNHREALEQRTDEILAYFRSRYLVNSQLNQKYDSLNLRQSDNPDLVSRVMKGEDERKDSKFVVVQIVISRFRNNLFHGLKNPSEIRDQNEVFSFINAYLAFMIDNQ